MKILRRCDVCNRWGAAYLVDDSQQGSQHLCYKCWKYRFAPAAARDSKPAADQPAGTEPTAANESKEEQP